VAVLFAYNKEELNEASLYLVALSAGALMGGAFLHLLPEALESIAPNLLFTVFLVSFVLFFLIEKILHWRHCHKINCVVHSFGYMNLVGDSIHNFIDGLVIASTFIVDIKLGLVTTLAIALHEIPQEIGDYGVLIYAGFKKRMALMVNYLVSLTVVLGGIVGFLFFSYLQGVLPYLLSFAAGGFVYIAASDLMPEIRKEAKLKRFLTIFLVFIFGIVLMYLVKVIDY
jgi:zinc and cadmium transporter